MKSYRLEKKTAARAGIQARLLGGEEWNQLADLGFIGLPSILGDLKGLGMLDRSRLCAIPFFQSLLPLRQRAAGTLLGEPFRALRRLFRDLIECPVEPGKPFVHLRNVGIEHCHLLLKHVIDGDHNVRAERLWACEAVREVEETGLFLSAGASVTTFGTVTIKAASCTRTPV